ncbi:MAG: DALR domain-containing protein, partial [Candidatus Bathyarchaeia archaeon]
LKAAQNTVERFRQFVDRLQEITKELHDSYVVEMTKSARMRFEEAMDDDLNITQALSSMFEYIREMNRLIDQSTVGRNSAAEAAKLMSDIDKILVIGKVEVVEPLAAEIIQLMERREQARAEGDWEKADQIRSKLKQQGIILEDTPQGIRWKKIS